MGKPFYELDIDAKGGAAPAKEAVKEVAKEEVAVKQEVAVKKEAPKKEVAKEVVAVKKGSRGERREPMSRMR